MQVVTRAGMSSISEVMKVEQRQQKNQFYQSFQQPERGTITEDNILKLALNLKQRAKSMFLLEVEEETREPAKLREQEVCVIVAQISLFQRAHSQAGKEMVE